MAHGTVAGGGEPSPLTLNRDEMERHLDVAVEAVASAEGRCLNLVGGCGEAHSKRDSSRRLANELLLMIEATAETGGTQE